MSLITLLLQVLIIVASARLLGWAFRFLGQPRVMGEMAAGILLGPSFLGWAAPEWSAALFPTASLITLNALSQLGLVLFMFLVGLRLETGKLRQFGRVAMAAGNASVLAPFVLGTALGVELYHRIDHPPASLPAFALFLGAAMSVTAFPVLARILADRGLTGTRLGTIAIACAAADDVTAWLILAAIIGLVRSGTLLALAATGSLLVLYLSVMWLGIRPLLRRWIQPAGSMTVPLILVLASACATEWIGIHALFGAFFAGVVMPKNAAFEDKLGARLEPLTMDLLLPLFFALTGLRTSLGLVSGLSMWLACGAIILVAVTGKWGGAMLAARWSGMGWREAAALGVLMNTRGLVELVILNIGLDLGILSPAIFSMMVAMALVTTLMTAPLLSWLVPISE